MPPEQPANRPEQLPDARVQPPEQPAVAVHAQQLIDGAARLLEPLARRFGMGPGAPLALQAEMVRVDPVRQLETDITIFMKRAMDVWRVQRHLRDIPPELAKTLIDINQRYRALPQDWQQQLIGFEPNGQPRLSRRFGNPNEPSITLRLNQVDIMGDPQAAIADDIRVVRVGQNGGPVRNVPQPPEPPMPLQPAPPPDNIDRFIAGAQIVVQGLGATNPIVGAVGQQAVNLADLVRRMNRR